MIAANLMTTNPKVLQPDDDISTAISLMQDANIRHLPVVTEEGDLVGMVSDRDLRALLVPHFFRSEPVQHTITRAPACVSNVMSSNVVCVDLEDDVNTVAELILEHKIGAVPVVDGDGKLVGIVSYLDLLRHYVRSED